MNARTIDRVLAAGLFVLAAASSASGQSYEAFQSEWARVTEKYLFRLGPFRAFASLDIRRLGYGDNIYFEDKPVRDFTATVAPSLTLYLPLRHRAILYVRESPEYTFYAKEAGLRQFTNGYGGGGRLLLFNRIVLSGDYARQSRLDAISVELGRPTRETRTVTSGGVFYETARRTSIGLTGSVERLSYQDVNSADGPLALSSTLDRTERSASMEIYYRLRGESFFFLKAGAAEYVFDRASVDRDAVSVQALAGVRFPILGRISGTLSLGYKKFDPKSAGRESFAGLIADSGIEARTGRFSFRAGLRRDLHFSYFENAFFYVEDSLSAGASFYPAGFLRLDYGYLRANLRYPRIETVDPVTGAVIASSRTDLQGTHSAALVFRILRTAGLGIRVTAERWTSTAPGWDRIRTYAGVYLTSRF
jgi:hypothetical protein